MHAKVLYDSNIVLLVMILIEMLTSGLACYCVVLTKMTVRNDGSESKFRGSVPRQPKNGSFDTVNQVITAIISRKSFKLLSSANPWFSPCLSTSVAHAQTFSAILGSYIGASVTTGSPECL